MAYICIPIMVEGRSSDAEEIKRAVACGAELIELRADCVADQPEIIERLLDAIDIPCIVTCRPTWEGGDYEGNDDARIRLFERVCDHRSPPRYLDVELRSYETSPRLRSAIDRLVGADARDQTNQPGLILSCHDFNGRPAGLHRRLVAMAQMPACTVIKIAYRARSLRDCIELFELLATRPKPMIAICMGEFGAATRILAGKFGSVLTYAAVTEQQVTAPGQPPINELLTQYRFHSITPATAVYGVIGYPVSQSMGPAVHNAGFEEVGHNGVYLPLPIAPGWESFKATLLTLLDCTPLNVRGLSVTLPHKEHLIRLGHEQGFAVDDTASLIGAGNTLTKSHDGWRVSNTDADAALACVVEGLGRADISGAHAAVIGAGGVARAVTAALAGRGAVVTIYNRTRDRAERLAAALDSLPGRVVVADPSQLHEADVDVIINATSIGMTGGPDESASPVPAECLRPGCVVFDTVYNPARTPLLREAAQAGCRTIEGARMFIHQAAAQFEGWTGKPAPIAVFEAVVHRQLTM
ncbi:MAG: type I 3-dehydroquinate dehydratase [Phycisphaerales bacterium]|nr:type I 3-dehydroquinate dehydratase [Phycisphaerales bacterium]